MVTLVAPDGTHPWSMAVYGKGHYCYFCKPGRYPPMLEGHTLCSRCGALIQIGTDDPMNLEMALCPPCEEHVMEHELH